MPLGYVLWAIVHALLVGAGVLRYLVGVVNIDMGREPIIDREARTCRLQIACAAMVLGLPGVIVYSVFRRRIERDLVPARLYRRLLTITD
jgi:hypothetical protein